MKVKSISLKNNSSVFTVLKGAFNALIVEVRFTIPVGSNPLSKKE